MKNILINKIINLFEKYPCQENDYIELTFFKKILEYQLKNSEIFNLNKEININEIFLKNNHTIKEYFNITIDESILNKIRARIYYEKIDFNFNNSNHEFFELITKPCVLNIDETTLELSLCICKKIDNKRVNRLILNKNNISSIEYLDDYIIISTNCNDNYELSASWSSNNREDLDSNLDILEMVEFYRLYIYNLLLRKLVGE